MQMTLDRNVESGTNVTSFLIKRYEPNPMWVTIDSNLEGYENGLGGFILYYGGGFILPQHANNALMNNFNKNIELLKTNGLIV